MNILSIQSWVAYGHVGNASAVFPLQRLGAEVWAVNTVQFSNHTGYGSWTGSVFTGEQVALIVEGIADRGVLSSCDAVLSGYMGGADIGDAILGAVARVRGENPAAVYCCDPVIGDDDHGVYVRPGIVELIRDRALAVADIATPNRFELSHLTGLPCATFGEVRAAIDALRALGPRIVLVTSVRTEDTPADCMDMLVADGTDLHRLRTKLLNLHINGAGDAIAALFLFHHLGGASAADALAAAGSALAGVLAATEAAGSRELLTVAAQDEWVRPSVRYVAERC